MSKTEANWMELDVQTLSKDAQAAYAAYKEASRKAAELRTSFEQMVNDAADLPAGKRLVFGYRFGKCSAALVDDDRKPKAASPAKLSLSQYLAREAGR